MTAVASRAAPVDEAPRLRGAFGVAIALAALAAGVVVPPFLPSYWLTVLVLFTINALLIVGYRLITMMGGWSFAQIALMGMGAYTMALLTTKLHCPVWPMLIVGPLAAGLTALILSYPVLRTRHYYFFLSTAAAAEAIRQCFLQFTDLTGGAYGVPFIKRPESFLGLAFTDNVTFFYLTFGMFVAVAVVIFATVDRTQLGKTIRAVALNENLSESLGVNTFRYRVFAFVVGSSVAGLAGTLFASFNEIVGPADFSTVAMFKIVAAAIVGGTTTMVGPLLGLFYLTALEEAFRGLPDFVPLLWGLSVIVVIRLLPDGLEGLLGLRWRGRAATSAEPAK